MAQVESPTAKLYAALALAIKGDSHDSATHICLDEASMAAMDEDTNAAGTESTKSGLSRAAIDTLSLQTTTKTNDTCRAYHTFTAGEAATIYGFLIMSAVSGGNCLGWCAFNASLALEATDQLVCQMDWQSKKD